MRSFENKVAAVTGAASGIGRVARRKCHLGLSDLKEDGLRDRARDLGVGVTSQTVDGVQRNQRRILVGPDAHVFDWVVRLLPTTYQRIAVGYSKFSAR